MVERNIPNYTHHTVILIPDQLFVLSILLASRGPWNVGSMPRWGRDLCVCVDCL